MKSEEKMETKSEEKLETKSEGKSKENLLPESFLKPES